MQDTHDLYWIKLAMFMGVVSHYIFVVGVLFLPTLVGFSTEIATYLYLFLLSFAVAQRMVPFFSHSMTEKNTRLLKQIWVLLLLHILLEGLKAKQPGTAAFDVLAQDTPQYFELINHDKFFISPHIGGSIEEPIWAMGMAAITGLDEARDALRYAH